jgi:plastocyanin
MPVIIIGGGYADKVSYVAPNQTFRWVNQDHLTHTVTSQYGLFDATLNPGDSFQFEIYYPGVYVYYCKLHPNETATLIVQG